MILIYYDFVTFNFFNLFNSMELQKVAMFNSFQLILYTLVLTNGFEQLKNQFAQLHRFEKKQIFNLFQPSLYKGLCVAWFLMQASP